MLLALALVFQEPELGRLVDALDAEDVQARDAAERALRRRPDARAALEGARAAGGERGVRASRLLLAFELERSLPPALREALPGVEDRVAHGRGLEAMAQAAPRVSGRDLEELAPFAARALRTEEERLLFCRVSGWKRPRTAVPALDGLLRVPDCRGAARHALVAIATPDAVRALGAEVVRGDDAPSYALFDLRALDRAAAIDGLASGLGAEEVAVRRRAATLLAEFGSDRGAEELLRDPKDIDAAVALALIGRPEGEEALVAALKPELNQRVLIGPLRGLSALGSRKAGPALRRLAAHEDSVVRAESIELLARTAAEEDLAFLGGLLGRGDWETRKAVVVGLGASGLAGARPLLERSLRDDEVFVRQEALRALVAARGEAYLDAALEFLDRSTINDVINAARALERMPRDVWRPRLRPWIDDPGKTGRMALALEILREPRYAPELLARFAGASDETRTDLASYFGAIGHREAAPALEKALGTAEDDFDRRHFAEALVRTGSRAGLPVFLGFARKEPTILAPVLAHEPGAPGILARLRATKVEIPPIAFPADVWARVARALGLELVLPDTLSWEEEWALRDPRQDLDRPDVLAVLEKLETSTPHATVIDGPRLRVLRREDALRHWEKR